MPLGVELWLLMQDLVVREGPAPAGTVVSRLWRPTDADWEAGAIPRLKSGVTQISPFRL